MSKGDYILDIPGLKHPDNADRGATGESLRGRPWLAVHWRCCSVYSRIYRHRDGSAYQGRCPRCGRPVQAQIAPNGTSARFFEAG
ncbi:MAG: hypothetical protein ACYC26_09145 [Phycisphaerales bacterium]